MRGLRAVVVGLLLLGLPGTSQAVRLTGVGASVTGARVGLVVRVHRVPGGLAGRYRCVTGPCLLRTGTLRVSLVGTAFRGTIRGGQGSCQITGTAVGVTLLGTYACRRVTGQRDTGTFAVR